MASISDTKLIHVLLDRPVETDANGATRTRCEMDSYYVVHDKCKFVDSQTLKLQEAPDMVPVGDLPRHTILNADR